MKRRMLAGLLVSAMTMTTLAGCGGGSQDSGTTAAPAETTAAAATAAAGGSETTTAETSAEAGGESIVSGPTELTFIFADGDEGAKASMNEIVNRFNEAYPDITVTIEPGNGGAYSEFLKTKEGQCRGVPRCDGDERYGHVCEGRKAGASV